MFIFENLARRRRRKRKSLELEKRLSLLMKNDPKKERERKGKRGRETGLPRPLSYFSSPLFFATNYFVRKGGINTEEAMLFS